MDRTIYDAMAEQDHSHWWYVARRDVLHDLIARRIAPQFSAPGDARILEIGCGTGHNLAMLQRFGQVEGIELDAVSRDLARQRFGDAVYDARLPELTGIDQATYDLVAILDVLEHVEDDVAALRACAALLKTGGRVLITVPQYSWMWTGHDVANHHFRRYSKGALRAAIAAADLRVEMMASFNSLLFPLAVASRMAARISGREGSDDAEPAAPVNAAFKAVFGLERHLLGRVPMPPGVSIAAVVSPR